MQHIYMFKKNNSYYNISSSEGTDMYNLPQYNSTIILYKGIDNKLQFSARNRDRKGVSLDGGILYLTIINEDLNFKLVKQLECEDEYKGLYNITLTEKEMRDFEPSYYNGSISMKKDNSEDILYSGIEWNPIFNIVVNKSYRDIFKQSHEIDTNNLLLSNYIDKDGIEYKQLTSSNIKADDSDSHTAIIYFDNDFCGKIILEGSGDTTPQHNLSDWFTIEEKEFDEKNNSIKNIVINKQLNCLWIRFRIIQKTTVENLNISKIIYRN